MADKQEQADDSEKPWQASYIFFLSGISDFFNEIIFVRHCHGSDQSADGCARVCHAGSAIVRSGNRFGILVFGEIRVPSGLLVIFRRPIKISIIISDIIPETERC